MKRGKEGGRKEEMEGERQKGERRMKLMRENKNWSQHL